MNSNQMLSLSIVGIVAVVAVMFMLQSVPGNAVNLAASDNLATGNMIKQAADTYGNAISNEKIINGFSPEGRTQMVWVDVNDAFDHTFASGFYTVRYLGAMDGECTFRIEETNRYGQEEISSEYINVGIGKTEYVYGWWLKVIAQRPSNGYQGDFACKIQILTQ